MFTRIAKYFSHKRAVRVERDNQLVADYLRICYPNR